METGDEQPLDTAAAEQGLMLRLMPAGGGAAEEITTDTILPGAAFLTQGEDYSCRKRNYTLSIAFSSR